MAVPVRVSRGCQTNAGQAMGFLCTDHSAPAGNRPGPVVKTGAVLLGHIRDDHSGCRLDQVSAPAKPGVAVGARRRRGAARAVVVRTVVLRTTFARVTCRSGRADTCRVTRAGAARVASARRTTSRVVMASMVFGTVSMTVVAGIAGCTMAGAALRATGASTGRRVTTVPAGVWVIVVSTGSAAIERVTTVWALALLAAKAMASATLEVARVRMGFAAMKASVR